MRKFNLINIGIFFYSTEMVQNNGCRFMYKIQFKKYQKKINKSIQSNIKQMTRL